MNATEELSRFLENRIPYAYRIETRPDDIDNQETDDSLGVVWECHVKPVVMNVDGRVCVAVIPATKDINLEKLRKYMAAENARLATEAECRLLSSDGDNGEMPIFGSSCGVPVLVPHELMDYQEITFIVGTPQVIVRIRLPEYLLLEKPDVCPRNAILSNAHDTLMHAVMVYRLDDTTLEKEPVGMLVDRRRGDRGNNAVGMLRLARKVFTDMVPDPSRIIIGNCV